METVPCVTNSTNQRSETDTPGTWVAPGFEPVRDTFSSLLDADEELGGGLCVYLRGRPVVDLWGGHATPARDRPWRKDTMVSTFSACKAMTALCLLHLIDGGKAALDDAVVDHWPEFATADAAAKSEVRLRHLLNHSAGLPVARTNRPGDVYHWQRMIGAENVG